MWGRRYFCTTVGSVIEDTIWYYIENQKMKVGREKFMEPDEFQSEPLGGMSHRLISWFYPKQNSFYRHETHRL